MEKGWGQSSVDFHNRARKVFFALYSEFKHSVMSLDRQRDENVFQQTLGRYVLQLKQQLQSIALNIIDRAEAGSSRSELNHILTSYIEDYVQEFIQKVRLL